jgi:hypothetical protein
MRRLVIAILDLLALAVIVLVVTGAVHVASNEDTVDFTVDKKELKAKADEGLERTRDAGTAILRRIGQAMQKAGEDWRRTPERQLKEGHQLPIKSSEPNADNSSPEPKNRPRRHVVEKR